MQVERFGLQIGGKSRHPRYGRPQDVPGRAPISDHQPPTRPGDNTPRIMTATGGENHAGPSWPNPRLSRSEDSNGGDIYSDCWLSVKLILRFRIESTLRLIR